jgi:hypothetical protein
MLIQYLCYSHWVFNVLLLMFVRTVLQSLHLLFGDRTLVKASSYFLHNLTVFNHWFSTIAPTDRIAELGWLMIELNSTIPNIPRLETVNVLPSISVGNSFCFSSSG